MENKLFLKIKRFFILFFICDTNITDRSTKNHFRTLPIYPKNKMTYDVIFYSHFMFPTCVTECWKTRHKLATQRNTKSALYDELLHSACNPFHFFQTTLWKDSCHSDQCSLEEF